MPGEVVLTGQLGLLSLFDLGQLLMLNGTTGEMSVTADGRRGYLYFVRGQIVNAVDDEYHEGEGAAYRLFTWRSGTFEFRPEAPTDSRAISTSTEGLMMEAARRMDEEGPGESTDVADRLARRASSLEALRLAFDSVANQARPVAEGGAPTGSPFGLLQSSADALLLRPHAVPRVRLVRRGFLAGRLPDGRLGTQDRLEARRAARLARLRSRGLGRSRADEDVIEAAQGRTGDLFHAECLLRARVGRGGGTNHHPQRRCRGR